MSASAPDGPEGDRTPRAQSVAPSVLPSTKWLFALVDFVEQDARSEGRDIARDLRAKAARLTPGAVATGRTDAWSARWVRQLAGWLRADTRPEAADLARQVDAWAQRLAAREQRVAKS